MSLKKLTIQLESVRFICIQSFSVNLNYGCLTDIYYRYTFAVIYMYVNNLTGL